MVPMDTLVLAMLDMLVLDIELMLDILIPLISIQNHNRIDKIFIYEINSKTKRSKIVIKVSLTPSAIFPVPLLVELAGIM